MGPKSAEGTTSQPGPTLPPIRTLPAIELPLQVGRGLGDNGLGPLSGSSAFPGNRVQVPAAGAAQGRLDRVGTARSQVEGLGAAEHCYYDAVLVAKGQEYPDKVPSRSGVPIHPRQSPAEYQASHMGKGDPGANSEGLRGAQDVAVKAQGGRGIMNQVGNPFPDDIVRGAPTFTRGQSPGQLYGENRASSTPLSSTAPSSSTAQSTLPSTRKVAFAENPKQGSLRNNLLHPLRSKRSWLRTKVEKKAEKKAEESSPMAPSTPTSSWRLLGRQQQPPNPATPADSWPITPGVARPGPPPPRPPRPESLFSIPVDDPATPFTAGPGPILRSPTPLPSPLAPAYGRANNPLSLAQAHHQDHRASPAAAAAAAVTAEQKTDAAPARPHQREEQTPQSPPAAPVTPMTPVVQGLQSRWSPDSSPERVRNPVRRMFGSLGRQSAPRRPGVRGLWSSSGEGESGGGPMAPRTEQRPETQAGGSGQLRGTLGKKPSVLLSRFLGKGSDK